MRGRVLLRGVSPVPDRRWSPREWMVAGAVAWIAATVLYLVVFGLRRVTADLPFAYGWPQVRLVIGTFGVAALLCPLVVLALRQVRRASPPPPLRIGTYVLLGITYWTGWAVMVALLFPAAGRTFVEAVSANLVMGALIILTIHAVVVTLFEAHWNLELARQAEAQALALQAELSATEAAEIKARLNPGLVFESLDTASSLMEEDERAARRVLADLSELLRVSLGREGVQLIPLKDELHLLLRYVRIRLARKRATPALELRLPPAAEVWPVPPLLLMSLVDDVLRGARYGNGSPIRLTVSAGEGQGGDPLRLSLELSGLELGEVPPAPAGGQIADTVIRLRAACGTGASVDVAPAPEGGVRIEVAIPTPAPTPSLLRPDHHAP
jgi:hypothetical protein